MRAPGNRIGRWSAILAIAVGLVGLASCTAERPGPGEGATPAAATQTPAPGTAPLQGKTILPPPVAMPGGGTRIDMRGSGKHTRALERQPDGSFKHVCVDAPEMGRPAR